MTMATITANRRPPATAAKIPTMAGIDAHDAATCMEPVPNAVTGSITSAGTRVKMTIAATMDTRRRTGMVFAGGVVMARP